MTEDEKNIISGDNGFMDKLLSELENMPLNKLNSLMKRKIPQYVRESPKVQRNEFCPCGSGDKYKKCCGQTSKWVEIKE